MKFVDVDSFVNVNDDVDGDAKNMVNISTTSLWHPNRLVDVVSHHTPRRDQDP